MLRIGWAARRGSAGSGTRWAALLFATAVLCLAFTALVAVYAGYAGTQERTGARSPERVTDGHTTTRARYLLKHDTLDDARSYTVAFVEPVSADVAPPPGLTSWPSPGQAVLSPALLKAGAGQHIADRYGTLAGTIGPQGLASPSERFAYVRPAHTMRGMTEARPIHGFGAAPEWGNGDFTNQRPIWNLLLTVGGFLLLPAAACAVLAARIGADERDRRTALVSALGALPSHRRLIVIGEAALPVVVGAVVGAVPAAVGCLIDVPVPFVHFTLHAPDLAAYAPWLVGMAVLSLVVMLTAVTVLPRRRRPGTATRPRASRPALTRFACWACPLFLLAASYGPGLAPSPTLRVLLQVVGTLGGFATLPSLLAAACKAAGSALAELSRRRAGPRAALVLSRGGIALDVAGIKQTANRTLAPGTDVSTLGTEWISGGMVLRDQSGWLLFFGLLGTSVLAVGFALNTQAEFLRLGRAAAPLAVLCGRRKVFYGLSGWSLLAPLLASGVVGALVCSWLAGPLIADGYAQTSPTLTSVSLGVSAALGLVLWVCGGTSAARISSRWRPNGD
ncbi:FtsX-like permease family protein [Streptomyces kronopolitis]|uniref:FtsX-like permease family protein n=1 Tax=Streptomyces kronopolitis TaxID=1612435 RepID=UPI003428304F